MIGWFGIAFAMDPVSALQQAEWQRLPVEQVLALPHESREATLKRIEALGRLRDAAALRPLREHLRSDVSEERAAAAFAMGLTPGSIYVLRSELRRALSDDEAQERGLTWHLIEAIGRQGGRPDVVVLTDLLQRDWPLDEAAARALLRLQRRGVSVESAVPSLVVASVRPDPRSTLAVAQALSGIGVEGADPTQLRWLEWQALSAPVSTTRASLVKALAKASDGEQRERVLRGGRSDLPVVRVAVLEALAERPLSGMEAFIEASIRSEDAWVREAAVGAAKTAGLQELLEAVAVEHADRPHRIASTVAAIGGAPPKGARWPIVAATIPHIEDDAEILALALDDAVAPPVRSAAVLELVTRRARSEEAIQLLASADPAVRSAAFSLLPKRPSSASVEEVLLTLRGEQDLAVLLEGLEKLSSWRRTAPGVVRKSRILESILNRTARSRHPALRTQAVELSRALGLPAVEVEADTEVRELLLPDGTVVTTTGELPDRREVQQYTVARVHTSEGVVELKLDPEVAPLAVHNFVSLARAGFYDGLSWHRVVPGFVAQTGCPRGDGWGHPGWMVVDEVSDRSFTPGALGMARSARDTGGSQWFVVSGFARVLEGDYTWFGRVVDGMETVRRLEAGDTIERIEILTEDG